MYPEETSDFFHGLFVNRPTKIFAILFSLIGSYTIVVLILYIDHYNKHSLDAKHTVASRLYNSAWLWALAWILTAQHIDMIRYIFGPLPQSVCKFNQLIKNCITIQGILIIDFSLTWRYLLIFWIKNPPGVDDKFWSKFLNMWIFLFTTITQSILAYWPNQNPADSHICSGTDPRSDEDMAEKKFLLNITIKYFTVILCTAILSRIYFYKRKISSENKVLLSFAVTWNFTC